MSELELAPVPVPAWLLEMEFCHVCPSDGGEAYCGAVTDGLCGNEDYDGEAICPSCGCPTCPRCAQLAALEDALEESE